MAWICTVVYCICLDLFSCVLYGLDLYSCVPVLYFPGFVQLCTVWPGFIQLCTVFTWICSVVYCMAWICTVVYRYCISLDLYSCVLYGLDLYSCVLYLPGFVQLCTVWPGFVRAWTAWPDNCLDWISTDYTARPSFFELISIQLTFVLPCMGLESSVGEPCRFDTVPLSVQFRTSYFLSYDSASGLQNFKKILVLKFLSLRFLLKLYGNNMVFT
jgi:hypothetical protein